MKNIADLMILDSSLLFGPPRTFASPRNVSISGFDSVCRMRFAACEFGNTFRVAQKKYGMNNKLY